MPDPDPSPGEAIGLGRYQTPAEPLALGHHTDEYRVHIELFSDMNPVFIGVILAPALKTGHTGSDRDLTWRNELLDQRPGLGRCGKRESPRLHLITRSPNLKELLSKWDMGLRNLASME